MKSKCSKNILLIIIIIAILSNLCIFFVPSQVQAASYKQTTINANSNNNNGISAFPASYQTMLKKLVSDTGHSNWKFKAFYTDIDWNELTSSRNENRCLRNTIHKSNGAWLCSCGKKGDKGYYCASAKIVNYYLDPRNFLTETTIFQFLDLSSSSTVSVSQIKQAVQGTWLAGSANGKTYAQMIYDAAEASGENALSIVVKIFQELGNGKTVPSMAAGKDKTYPKTYNFFNYGATDGAGNLQRGLAYAYKAGWNTPQKALTEGAKLISNSYIKAGQNTKYTFKFDVVSDNATGLYWHQYMTNVQDPTNQAKMLYDEYLNNNWLNQSLTFIIPVYKNMPAYIKLPSSLTPNNGTLYFIGSDYSNVTLRKSASASSSSVASLRRNTVVLMQSYNVNKSGWSKVKVDGKTGYVSNKYLTAVNTKADTYKVPNQPANTTVSGNVAVGHDSKVKGTNIYTEGSTTLNDVKKKYSVQAATKNGVAISNTTNLATGMTISINNKKYSVVKLGDSSGDGYINSADLLKAVKHLNGVKALSSSYKTAADVNMDGKVNSADLLGIVKHLNKTSTINL